MNLATTSAAEAVTDPSRDDFQQLNQLLQDRVRTVVRGFHSGAYIHGRPGTGKTHTVMTVLKLEDTRHVYVNGRITPAALFELLAEAPESLLVIDDVTTLIKNPQAAELLMAATGGETGQPRPVKYRTKTQQRTVMFRGGIICISNRPLRNDPAGAALASRLAVLEYEPTEAMLLAFARCEASKGVCNLSPSHCLEVLHFLIEHCREDARPFDFRLFYKALADFRAFQDGVCDTDWRTLVKSLGGPVTLDSESPLSRAEKKASEQDLVRKLDRSGMDRDAQLKDWHRQTGKAEASFYRRLDDVRRAAAIGRQGAA